MSPPRPSDREV